MLKRYNNDKNSNFCKFTKKKNLKKVYDKFYILYLKKLVIVKSFLKLNKKTTTKTNTHYN